MYLGIHPVFCGFCSKSTKTLESEMWIPRAAGWTVIGFLEEVVFVRVCLVKGFGKHETPQDQSHRKHEVLSFFCFFLSKAF